MKIKISELELPGCYLIEPIEFSDERGNFVKTFHEEVYRQAGLDFIPTEEFFSYSKKHVLRGLHFQTPPNAHNKMVYCPHGEVLDLFVDLRKSSPTYGHSLKMALSQQNKSILYLPIGIAHGFLALRDNSLMIYKTDHVYAPEHDTGILWRSVGIKLPIDNPLVSARDASFETLQEFDSPFE